MPENRRQYSRVAFHAPARLVFSTRAFDTVIIDLSLKGGLVRLPAQASVAQGENAQLHIPLDDSGQRISMAMRIVHIEGRYAGLHCEHIDLDSVTHLRRLVELNLGAPELLDRELSSLAGETDRTP